MPVIKIKEYAARETVAALRELLAQAEAGEITGFAFACKLGLASHGIGLTGDYRENPAQVLAVTGRINHRVNQIIDGREQE